MILPISDTTKLSLAIIWIKQLNVCCLLLCSHQCQNQTYTLWSSAWILADNSSNRLSVLINHQNWSISRPLLFIDVETEIQQYIQTISSLKKSKALMMINLCQRFHLFFLSYKSIFCISFIVDILLSLSFYLNRYFYTYYVFICFDTLAIKKQLFGWPSI